MKDKTWRYYDTAHVVYYPKKMTVEEFEKVYDEFCRKIYSPFSITRRGWRTLRRHSLLQIAAEDDLSFIDNQYDIGGFQKSTIVADDDGCRGMFKELPF